MKHFHVAGLVQSNVISPTVRNCIEVIAGSWTRMIPWIIFLICYTEFMSGDPHDQILWWNWPGCFSNNLRTIFVCDTEHFYLCNAIIFCTWNHEHATNSYQPPESCDFLLVTGLFWATNANHAVKPFPQQYGSTISLQSLINKFNTKLHGDYINFQTCRIQWLWTRTYTHVHGVIWVKTFNSAFY